MQKAVAVVCLVVACSLVVEADTVRKSQKPSSTAKTAAKTTTPVRNAQSQKGKGTAAVQLRNAATSARTGGAAVAYRTIGAPKKAKCGDLIQASSCKSDSKKQNMLRPAKGTPAAAPKKKWIELKKIGSGKSAAVRNQQQLLARSKKGSASRSAHLMKPAYRSLASAATAPQQPVIMNARFVRSGFEFVPERHDANAKSIIQTAYHFLKTAYRSGGSSPAGFDCSGFTHYVFQKHGVELPRSSVEQAQRGASVNAGQLRTGDLVFFSTLRRGISHVGIFVANGLFIHSASRGKGVSLDSMFSKYWGKRFIMAKRVDLTGARQYALLDSNKKAG